MVVADETTELSRPPILSLVCCIDQLERPKKKSAETFYSK